LTQNSIEEKTMTTY